jgi:hypothetical protein
MNVGAVKAPTIWRSQTCKRSRRSVSTSPSQSSRSTALMRKANPLVPTHSKMRAFDRDLIRGGHYGQRSCEPHLKAEHMAAPTNAANVKKVLANSEPSTHGTSRQFLAPKNSVAFGGTPDIGGFWSATDRSRMTQVRHWPCTAAIVLMPVSAPIKVLD